MAESENSKPREMFANPCLQTVYVDNLAISGHTADNEADRYLIRFATQMQEGLYEQARLVIPQDRLKVMLNVLCRHSKYYPEKPKETPKTKPKPKKD